MSMADSTAAARGDRRGSLDDESREWLQCLRAAGAYKTMFDARRKIRAYLIANRYLDDREQRIS
jgi:hypothetical protein